MQSLAEQVLGVSRLDEPDAIQKAYSRLAGIEWSKREFQNECSRLDNYDLTDWDGISLYDQENITTLGILRQIFTERQIRYSNALQDWPAYEVAYSKLEASAADQGSGWALQVGCLTAVSSAAFSALSREVYGAEPVTIDLTTSVPRARHGNYVITDAMEFGLAGNSIKFAQTNHLLNMLRTPQDLSSNLQILNVFREIYRVLRPGGHVLLYEIAPALNFAEHPAYESQGSQDRIVEFKEAVGTNLLRAGFASIIMEPAMEIEGVDYLFDQTRDFSQYKTHERRGTIVISAGKPEI